MIDFEANADLFANRVVVVGRHQRQHFTGLHGLAGLESAEQRCVGGLELLARYYPCPWTARERWEEE